MAVYFSAQTETDSQKETSSDEEHFVDIHCTELIQRVALVSPILDDLKQWKLLKLEQYHNVYCKGTPQDKMRELFFYVHSWGNFDKDLFLQSLREHNAPLIRDLEWKQSQKERAMDVK